MSKRLSGFYVGILLIGSSGVVAAPIKGYEARFFLTPVEINGILFPKRDKSLPPPRPLPPMPRLPPLPPR